MTSSRAAHLGVLVCCAGLYLLTLTHVHTFDALSYILDVDRKPWPELFHPHHLAYGPLGALIRAAAVALGWRGSAAVLIQAANALAGAAGVALFAGVARRATGRADLAAAGALLLGASYAYWYYAVEVEVYTIAALFLVVCLGLIVALARRPSPALAAALGLAQGLAVLFHQTNVLLCVPAIVVLVAGGRRQAAEGRPALLPPAVCRLAIAYLIPLGLIVAGAYLAVGVGVSGFRSLAELAAWMEGYARTGYWGGAVDGAKLAGLGAGLSQTLAPTGGAALGLGLAALLVAGLGGLRAAPRALVWALVAWLLVYGAFFLWWEPENIEFWIASLPPFYLLLVLAAGGGGRGAGGRWSVVALFALGLAMLGVNLGAVVRRGDAATDLQRLIAGAVAQNSAEGDLLVVPDGLQELYLPYYAGRNNVASLTQAMAAGGGWPAACARLRGRVEQALASGYGALLAADAMRPAPAPPGEPPTMAERFRLAPEVVAGCYAPLAPMMTPLGLGAGLPAYSRIPAAQALADGPGWDFRRGRWGWRAQNAGPEAITAAGWALTPAADPAIISPPIALDAARYRAIELRLAATTASRDAQLFFLDASGRADEGRSLRWRLQAGPEPHTYRLELRGAPGWQGRLGGLRLDPVGAGDGGALTVEWIRLLP